MSEQQAITVTDWVSWEEPHQNAEDVGIPMGGWVKGTGWDEYIECIKDEYKPYYEALKDSIIELGIRRGGFWHQQESGTPLFSDGKYAQFSMRSWGDLMASVWNEEDGHADGSGFQYIHFAWYTRDEEDQR